MTKYRRQFCVWLVWKQHLYSAVSCVECNINTTNSTTFDYRMFDDCWGSWDLVTEAVSLKTRHLNDLYLCIWKLALHGSKKLSITLPAQHTLNSFVSPMQWPTIIWPMTSAGQLVCWAQAHCTDSVPVSKQTHKMSVLDNTRSARARKSPATHALLRASSGPLFGVQWCSMQPLDRWTNTPTYIESQYYIIDETSHDVTLTFAWH